MGVADGQGEEAKPQGQHDDVEHLKRLLGLRLLPR